MALWVFCTGRLLRSYHLPILKVLSDIAKLAIIRHNYNALIVKTLFINLTKNNPSKYKKQLSPTDNYYQSGILTVAVTWKEDESSGGGRILPRVRRRGFCLQGNRSQTSLSVGSWRAWICWPTDGGIVRSRIETSSRWTVVLISRQVLPLMILFHLLTWR